MRRQLKEQDKVLLKEIFQMAWEQAGGEGKSEARIIQPRICDCCQLPEREAHPYYLIDGFGQQWNHLCNLCCDLLS